MTTIIVDTSAVIAVLLKEATRPSIIKATQGVLLASPETLPFEVTNALSARMKRSDEHRLSGTQASAAFAQFRLMEIRLLPVNWQDHEQALNLASLLGIYAYDAYLLVAALNEKAALLTLDGMGRKPGLYQQAERMGISVVNLRG